MNLGDIAGGSVQAYINGKLANANVSPKDGVETDITALLKPGVNEIKVIFASTLFNRARVEPAILDPKSQRPDQPQLGPQRHAGPADVARVVGDFRFVQNHV